MFQPSCRHPSLQSDTGGTVFLSRLGVRPGGFLFWAMFGIRGAAESHAVGQMAFLGRDVCFWDRRACSWPAAAVAGGGWIYQT